MILTLASPVQPDDVVRFAYAIPDTNALRGESGNFIAGFDLDYLPVRHPYTRPAHGQVVQSDRLEVTFYKALDAGFEPAPSAFTVTAKRVSRAVTGVSLDGAKVILTLASPVQPDDAVRLTYTVPDANALRGESGNFIAGFEDFPVLNPLSSSSGPEDRSRVVQGDRLEVTFSEALDAGFEPAPSAFEVTFDNIPQEVTGVSLDGAKLILTLASPVQPGDAVQLGYAIPDTNALRGESGSTVAGFDKHLVTNLDTASTGIVLTLAPTSVHEDDGATEVTVTASLNAGVRTEATEVTVSVAGNTATEGTDFTAVEPFTVTIPGDQRSGTGTFTLTPTQDETAEGAETLTVSGSATGLTGSTATLTLADNDTASTGVALTLAPTSVHEDDGATEVTVTALLDAGARTAATEVTVSVAGNTATEGTDFTAVDGFTVTIPAMQTSSSTVFTFIPIQDETAEGAETLTVSGSATGLTGSTATLTLADDDTASTGIALTLDPAEVAEGAGETEVTVTASLDAGARTAATEVTVSVAGNTATAGTDFTAVEPFTVTIPAMQASTSTVFTFIPIQDETAEGAETLTVSGSATGLTVDTATLTLIDDDTASTGVALTLEPAEVAEGAGKTEVTVTALLNAGARTAATEVTVSVAGNTATAGTDFTAVDDFTVTIPAMQASTSTTFTFIPIQDETAEGAETLTVSGSATGLTVDTATLTLIDDDTRGVSVHPTSVTVTEGDANAGYAVKLATKPTGDVTVMVHGADADVSVSPRSLTFTPLNWDRPQTVTVEAVNDSVAEREERVTLTHTVSGGDYDGVAAAPVSVQVVNNDVGAVAEWLVRAGRTVAGQAMDVLTARLDGGGESYLAVGEHRLVGSSGAALERDAGDGRMRSVGREQPLTERELLLGSAFHLRSGVGEPGGAAFAAWGRIASDRFAGKADGLALDGEIRTSFVGADLSAGGWLAGTALAFSRGEGGYGLAGEGGDRAVASRLTSLFPYAQVRLGERVSAWGLAGRGTGKLTVIERGGTGADRYATDIEMHMGAAGVGGTLATAPEGIELGLRSDVFWMRTSSDPIEEIGVASSELEANRLRLVLDASRPYTVGEGTTLTPSLEVGVRQDGGDAETGRGVEVGAGLRYAGTGFRIEGTVRGLAVHDESVYEEWGASGSVHIEPGGSGRGLSLTLAPAWGNPSSAGRRLWSARDAADLAPARDIEAGRRLDAEVGYGLRSPSGPGVVTPYAALSMGEGAGRTLRTGMRWRLAPAATLGLEASRAGSPGGDEGPVNALTLRASVRW